MKPLLFRVPTVDDRSFWIEQDSAPHFYGHLHFHPEVQLTLIQQGEGTLIVGDKLDRFDQYDILLMGANLPHVLLSDPRYYLPGSTQLATSVTVLFRPEHLEATMLSLPETKHLRFLLQEAQHGVRLRCRVSNALTAQVENMPKQRPFEQLLGLLHLLDNLATNPDREVLSATAYAKPQRPDDQRRLEQVFSYILQQYARPISLEDVANVANLTPGAFCRFFGSIHVKRFRNCSMRFALNTRVVICANHGKLSVRLPSVVATRTCQISIAGSRMWWACHPVNTFGVIGCNTIH